MSRNELNPIFCCSEHPGPWVLGFEATIFICTSKTVLLSPNNGKDGRIIEYIIA